MPRASHSSTILTERPARLWKCTTSGAKRSRTEANRPRVALEETLAAFPRHPARELAILEDLFHLRRQLDGIAVFEDEAAVPDDAGHGSRGRGDHRGAAGPRLQEHDAEGLETRRKHQD